MWRWLADHLASPVPDYLNHPRKKDPMDPFFLYMARKIRRIPRSVFFFGQLPASSGHLVLFSLSMPRLSFLTAFFLCLWGTTLKNFFSCPAFWHFSQLFYTFSQFSRFSGASDSFFSSCAPFILFHCFLFRFPGHHTQKFLLMPRRT